MSLFKTTILPTDSKKDAVDMLNELIFDEPYVLLVVLGKSTEAQTIVDRANRLAGSRTDPRWVVWARKPDQILELISELEGGDDLVNNYDSTLAFSLSFSDEVRDRITVDENDIRMVRIMKSFMRAEQN